MNSVQVLALAYVITWEDYKEVDEEIRRDRMALVASQPENSQKIFQTFKTRTERKKAPVDPIDQVPSEFVTETEDEEVRKLFENINTLGYSIEDV